MDKPIEYPVCFVHMLRTGGTSLSRMVRDVLGDQCIHRTHQAELIRDILIADRSRNRLWIGGHFLAKQWRRFVGTHQLVTFLRHPATRIKSYYRLILDSPQHGQHERVRKMTFREFVLDNKETNGMIQRLLGRKVVGFDRAAVDEAMLVLKQFAYVGIFEEFYSDVKDLFSKVGLTPPSVVTYANWTDPSRHPETESMASFEIEEVNASDVVLWSSVRYQGEGCKRYAGNDRPEETAALDEKTARIRGS